MVKPSDKTAQDVGSGTSNKVQEHAQGKYAGERDFETQLSDKDPAA